MANRVSEVNARLKALGFDERLKRGNGYYYFIDGDALSWYSSSVPVCHASSLSVDRWIEEYNSLKTNWRNS